MAEKRMFTQKICDSDAFLDMPLTTQALYFHLNMRADDDGFVNNPKKIQRMIGASEDDLKLLVLKRFILTFDNGVIVIKHWRMHNLLRKDRYHPTQYQEELALLDLKENGSYTEKISENTEVIELATNWQPTGNQLATEVSVGKVRLDKVSVGKCSAEETPDNTQKSLMRAFARNMAGILSMNVLEEQNRQNTKRQIILRLLRNGAKRMQQQEKLRKRNSAIFRTGIMMYLI